MKIWTEQEHDEYFKRLYGGLFDDEEPAAPPEGDTGPDWEDQLQKWFEQGGHP